MQRVRLLIMLFLGIFFLKQAYTATAPFNGAPLIKLEDATLIGDPEFSTLTFKFSKPVTYQVDPRLGENTIVFIFNGVTYGPAIDYKDLADYRIRRVGFKLVKGNAEASVVLKDLRNAISHSLSPDGMTLTVRFKQRTALMPLMADTSSPEERAAKAERDKELARKAARLEKESGREAWQKVTDDMQRWDFKQALVDLDAFTQRYPKSVFMERAMYLRAEAYYMLTAKERKYAYDAVNAYRAAMSKFPDSDSVPRATLRLGDLYYNQEMDIEALATYQGIFDKFPKSKFAQRALMGRARIFVDRELYYEAYNELEKILLLYPGSADVKDATFQIAEAYYMRGKYEQALKAFEDGNKRWPTHMKQNPQTYFRYADTLRLLDKKQKAAELFFDIANLYPTNIHGMNSVNRLADIYIADGKIAAAVRLLGVQARAWPDQPPGVESRLRLAALGQAERKVVSPEEASITPYPDYMDPLASYNDIIKKHGDWKELAQEAMFQKAKYYHRNKRYIESVLTLQGLMRRYPDIAATPPLVALVKENLYDMVRNFHRQQGSFAVLYTYYGNFDPFFADLTDPGLIMSVGDAYYEMGMYARSREKYQRAASLAHGEYADRVAFGGGRALAAMDDFAGATRELTPFMDEYADSPYAPHALQVLGDIHALQNNRLPALAAYHASLDSTGDGLLASYTAYRAGMLQKKNGMWADAIALFKTSVERYKPLLNRIDEYYRKDSQFQIMEAAYRGRFYRDAISYSEAALANYPDDKLKEWARFVKSDSEAKLSEDEKAIEGLRGLAKDSPTSIFGKVAQASVGNAEWKVKNRDLFPY